MRRVAVINVVGLCESLFGAALPFITSLAQRGAFRRVRPAFPAVTCTAQSNYLTGVPPAVHGVVANGWYNRELAEIQFWKQSNHLVQAPKVWEHLRASQPGFSCAKLFWWYNMYSTADYSITPRPMYPADGRKVFDIYAWPFDLKYQIKQELGEFPFPAFWGPAAGRDTPQATADAVSKWIAASAMWVERQHSPALTLVYLPHLDYNLQRLGPRHPDIATDLRQIDSVVHGLVDFFSEREVSVLLLSEYGIEAVEQPVHLNRLFRKQGWLAIKEELGLELLDAGASKVFAVADHQIAHIYVNDPQLEPEVRHFLEAVEGVEQVLGPAEKKRAQIDHERAGNFVVVARPGAWFTYYYWLDDHRAPDFARTVDIHRKPGYDPVELFLAPDLCCPKLQIAWRLLKKKMGMRMLMDVIPLDASLVRGSHGRTPSDPGFWPVLITDSGANLPKEPASTDVFRVIEELVHS